MPGGEPTPLLYASLGFITWTRQLVDIFHLTDITLKYIYVTPPPPVRTYISPLPTLDKDTLQIKLLKLVTLILVVQLGSKLVKGVDFSRR